MTAQRNPPDPDAESLLERVFPDHPPATLSPQARQLFAVIPEAVIQASPDDFASFLDAAFADDDDVERFLDRGLSPGDGAGGGRQALRALVPVELLSSRGGGPARLVDEVFTAFDDITALLASLEDRRRTATAPTAPPTLAVVPDEVLADPERLLRTVDRMRTEAEKLELLLRQARHTLTRLKVYRLSQRPRGQLVNEMRRANRVADLQYLVDFLRSIQLAADSFERLDLPRPHIRDYLEHLYQLEDWEAMADLVQSLRKTVLRFVAGDTRRRPMENGGSQG